MVERMEGFPTLEAFSSSEPKDYYDEVKEWHGDVGKENHGEFDKRDLDTLTKGDLEKP